MRLEMWLAGRWTEDVQLLATLEKGHTAELRLVSDENIVVSGMSVTVIDKVTYFRKEETAHE